MPNPQSRSIQDTVESLLFSHYLRTGQRLYGELAAQFIEQKFNPNHDPDDGRFTFGSGEGSLPPRASSGGITRMARMRDKIAPAKPAVTPKSTPTSLPWAKTHPGERLPVWRSRDRSTERGLPEDWRYGTRDNMSREEVERHADHAQHQFFFNWGRGMSVDEAAAWAANSEVESGGDHLKKQDGGGPGQGLYQWGAHEPKFDRRIDFAEVMHVPIEQSTLAQQHAFRDWELTHKEATAKRLIDAAIGAGAKAEAISRKFLRPGQNEVERTLTAKDRANIAEAIMRRIKSK
jgi:hypothetical protein